MAKKPAGRSSTRTYNSSRRQKQAAQTRRDVLMSAVDLFRAGGWSGTTLAAIAEHAGVAVETVYKGFGSKKALLRAAMDTAVVGDAEPVPFVERSEFSRMGEGTLEQRITHAVAVVTEIHERSAGIWQAVLEAAGGDEEVDNWRIELEKSRRIDVERSAEAIVGAPLADLTITSLWVLSSPEAYLKLVGDAVMTRGAYEAFLADSMRRLLATDPR